MKFIEGDVREFSRLINAKVDLPSRSFSLGEPSPWHGRLDENELQEFARSAGFKMPYFVVTDMVSLVFHELAENQDDVEILKTAKILHQLSDGEYAPIFDGIIRRWEAQTGLEF